MKLFVKYCKTSTDANLSVLAPLLYGIAVAGVAAIFLTWTDQPIRVLWLAFLFNAGLLTALALAVPGDRKYLSSCFCMAFILRISIAMYAAHPDLAVGGQGFSGGDDLHWYAAGRSAFQDLQMGRTIFDIIVNGIPVEETSIFHHATVVKQVGYPLMIAFFMEIGLGKLMNIIFFNCFLDSLTMLLAYSIALRILNLKAAQIAALFVCFSNGLVFSINNYRDSVIAFLTTFFVFLAVHKIDQLTPIRWVMLLINVFMLGLLRFASGLVGGWGLISLALYNSTRLPVRFRKLLLVFNDSMR